MNPRRSPSSGTGRAAARSSARDPVERLDGDPFVALDRLPAPVEGVEVGGGWFGYLGYRLGARIERLPPSPPRPVPLPDAQLAFYDHVLRQDADGRWWFEALHDMPERLAEIEALLARRARAGAAAGRRLQLARRPATPRSCRLRGADRGR